MTIPPNTHLPVLIPGTGRFESPLVWAEIEAAARDAAGTPFEAGEGITLTPGPGGVVTISAAAGTTTDWGAAINALNGA